MAACVVCGSSFEREEVLALSCGKCGCTSAHRECLVKFVSKSCDMKTRSRASYLQSQATANVAGIPCLASGCRGMLLKMERFKPEKPAARQAEAVPHAGSARATERADRQSRGLKTAGATPVILVAARPLPKTSDPLERRDAVPLAPPARTIPKYDPPVRYKPPRYAPPGIGTSATPEKKPTPQDAASPGRDLESEQHRAWLEDAGSRDWGAAIAVSVALWCLE